MGCEILEYTELDDLIRTKLETRSLFAQWFVKLREIQPVIHSSECKDFPNVCMSVEGSALSDSRFPNLPMWSIHGEQGFFGWEKLVNYDLP